MTVRVLQVMGRSAGGIARHVAEITAALDGAAGIEVDVAGPSDLPIPMPKPVRTLVIPEGPLVGHRRAIRELRTWIADYDLVHAHGLRAGIDAALGARGTNVPTFVTIHNLVRPEIAGRLKAPLYRRGERLVTRLADRVFCVSRDIYEHLRDLAPSKAAKIELTYLGIHEPPPPKRSGEEIREDLGVGNAGLVVTASRLSAQKALPVMFEAVAGIDAAVLAVLGEGPQRAELEKDAALKLGERARFLGFRPDVVDHIRAADVFCLSSVWEGVPLAAQEAILVGTPVVATNVGGMDELVTDRVSGRLVPANDPAALRDALQEVLSSPEVARGYAARAREHLAATFSPEVMLRHLTKAYLGAADAS
jgi:glycosyltransferase involved in cell wall biosynthesis